MPHGRHLRRDLQEQIVQRRPLGHASASQGEHLKGLLAHAAARGGWTAARKILLFSGPTKEPASLDGSDLDREGGGAAGAGGRIGEGDRQRPGCPGPARQAWRSRPRRGTCQASSARRLLDRRRVVLAVDHGHGRRVGQRAHRPPAGRPARPDAPSPGCSRRAAAHASQAARGSPPRQPRPARSPGPAAPHARPAAAASARRRPLRRARSSPCCRPCRRPARRPVAWPARRPSPSPACPAQ